MPIQTALEMPRDECDERQVLAGLMRSDVLPAYLIAKGVTAADLFHHSHRVVWGVLWELVGCGVGRNPADVYLVLRGSGLAAELGGNRAAACWLADVWCEYRGTTAAARAAERVLWLSERRAAIHQASESIADAVAGRVGPASYRVRRRRETARAI